jgi:hypothetical protein
MSTASPYVVPSAQSSDKSALLVAGLVIAIVALSLCTLLTFQHIQNRIHSRNHLKQSPSLLPVLEKTHRHTPASSTSSFNCSRAKAVAASTTLVHSQWHAQKRPADRTASYGMQSIYQSIEELATTQSPRPQGHKQSGAIAESLLDDRGSYQPKDASARRLGLDLERVWPQPLLPAQTERSGRQEQWLWRNSSGGSSFYSRPSSWYSVTDAGEQEGAVVEYAFGAGPGPTIRANQVETYRYKALPPLPI